MLAKDRRLFQRLLGEGGAALAPMAGFSDAPFRRLARAFGAAWAVTEMVSARALSLGDERGMAISAPYPGEPQVVVQIFAGDPEEAAVAAARIESRYAPSAIDLNMGCPVPKITQRGCGALLMRDPERAAAIVRAMDRAVTVPVSVKTRLGYDTPLENEVLAAVVDAGAAAIAIHGRTAAQRYTGEADWEAIAALAAKLPVPVIGSGDIRSPDDYRRARALGLGVMVARAAMGRPWFFREVLGGPAATPAETVKVSWQHAHDHVGWYGSERALLRLRQQLAAYAIHAGAPREPFVQVSSLADLARAWHDTLGIDPSSQGDHVRPLSGSRSHALGASR
jgi:tRNA-dihydrouridine synthase B